MTPAVNRDAEGLAAALPGSAYTGGADWDLRFRKRYAFTGYLAGSTVRGTPEAIAEVEQNSRHYFQRPDATAFTLERGATSLDGVSGRFRLGKIGGQRTRFNSEVGFKSPGFDLNDTGFLRRADERWTSNWFQLRSEVPNRWIRNRYFNVNQWAAWNYDGDRLFSAGNVNASVTWINNWATGGGVGVEGLGFDDRRTRGGPGAYSEGYTNFWSWLNSDSRRRVAFNVFEGGGRNGVGSWYRDHEFEVTFRPITALTLTSGVRFNRSVNDSQWIENVSDSREHYAFGRIDQTTVTMTERVNYTMTPNLSLQLYAQPFVSGGEYSGFKELADGRSVGYDGRYTPYAYAGDPEFNVKSFRTTNVLRWEYKPGSTLFVVWQQARENDALPGGFRFGRDVRDIFGVAPRNVFLVKLAYWLNY
jgi:hypothetical protein